MATEWTQTTKTWNCTKDTLEGALEATLRTLRGENSEGALMWNHTARAVHVYRETNGQESWRVELTYDPPDSRA